MALKFVLVLGCLFSLASPAATVLKVQGQAHQVLGGKKVPINKGDSVANGTLVKTGRKSLVLLKLDAGGLLKLNQKSSLIFKEALHTEVRLKSGSLFSKFKRSKKRRSFRVKTPAAVAGVRGTEFFASYGPKGKREDVFFCVHKGVIEVENNKMKSTVAVKAGEGVAVKNGQDTSKPRNLPWTERLNWGWDPQDEIMNTVNIESAYTDLLDRDYD